MIDRVCTISLFFGFGAALLTACAPLAPPSEPWRTRTHAPTHSADVGIVLHAPTLSEDELHTRLRALAERYPQMQVRSVPISRGMLEIFSVAGREIALTFPEALILPNAYKESLPPQQRLRSACVLPQAAIQVLTIDQERVFPESTWSVRDFREFELWLDSDLVDFTLDRASVRWEVLHVPTLRTVAKLHGLRPRLTLSEPGEYRVQVSVLRARASLRCTSEPIRFALRSMAELADPGEIPALPPLERLGVLFPHLVTIEAIPARVKTAQGEGVTVAVIDTGIHYNHPDLHPQISTTARGWNFIEGDALPFDSHGHGTQVAGLIAATGYGVAPRAKLLPIRVINAFGGSDALSVAAGIRYASEQGARVINLSLGTDDPLASPLLEEAIRAVTAQGALVVAASGNGALDGTGLSLDAHPVYPAALEIPGLLTVLATDLQGERTDYTHYSAKKVAMGAPGGTEADGGLSTTNAYLALGRLRPLMGSSASAPLVSGAAALLWSSVPSLTAAELQRILETYGTRTVSLRTATRSGNSLNAYSAALQALQTDSR